MRRLLTLAAALSALLAISFGPTSGGTPRAAACDIGSDTCSSALVVVTGPLRSEGVFVGPTVLVANDVLINSVIGPIVPPNPVVPPNPIHELVFFGQD